ncbi:hypothetical protein [Pontibacter akesuensis]|uniref:Uncharacterized protein n=1 Tax=Pontibacter akesuensis TaxID=388950 RepID=A0A1I7I854_9BACT|nr:hypothetical protein [Pontibacter akesuensis]GHA65706.1 hypothetical protein GCM10007389_18290 [Pontibacter akesuensis]SFU69081.1 hypothetical protein SAMN04487941_1996 [Pontibacter akesuensis]
MKIVILIFACMAGMSASIQKSAKDVQEIQSRHELREYKAYPNLLPQVEIVAPEL